LTPERRAEIARKAATSRWDKDLPEADYAVGGRQSFDVGGTELRPHIRLDGRLNNRCNISSVGSFRVEHNAVIGALFSLSNPK